MWALDVFDKHGELMFDGEYDTPAEVGQFVEDTFELFREEGAHLYRLTSPERCVEYTADEAATCLNAPE